MKCEAQFHSVDGETLRIAARQASQVFSARLAELAEPAPVFERVARIYVLLTLNATTPFTTSRSRGSFHRAGETYHIWSGVDPFAFASAGWNSRVRALAQGVREAVFRIAKTRVSDAERTQLLDWISRAEERSLDAEPADLVSISGAELCNAVQHDPPPPKRHVRLYKLEDRVRRYREAWFVSAKFVEHEGIVGKTGSAVSNAVASEAEGFQDLKQFENAARQDGFRPVSSSKEVRLIVEYASDTLPNDLDAAAIERLHNTLDEILGWTGLGYCDGGSSGSGTAELCCFVVDFKLAKAVIEARLPEAGWSHPIRIYRER